MNKLEAFKQQYGGLHDAVVRSLSYTYSKTSMGKRLDLRVECLNQISGAWQLLQLNLLDVQEFRFQELGRSYNGILFDVAQRFNGVDYLFDFASVEGEDAAVEFMGESPFFLRCRDFEYEVVEQL
jgi:hypothetical protein